MIQDRSIFDGIETMKIQNLRNEWIMDSYCSELGEGNAQVKHWMDSDEKARRKEMTGAVELFDGLSCLIKYRCDELITTSKLNFTFSAVHLTFFSFL